MAPRRSARGKKKADPATRGKKKADPATDDDAAEGNGAASSGGGSRTKKEGGAGRGEKNGRKRKSSRGAGAQAPHDHSIGECLGNVGVTRAELESCDSLDDEFQAIKRSYFKRILEEHPDKGGDPELFRRTRASFEVLRELKGRGELHSFLPHLGDDAAASYERVYEAYQNEKGAVPSYEYYQEAAEEVTPGYRVELAKTSRSQCVRCRNRAPPSGKATTTKVVPTMRAAGSDAGRRGPPSAKKPRTGAADSVTTAAAAEAGDPGTQVARVTATTRTMANPTARPPSFIGKDAIRVGSLDDRSGGYGRWFHLMCWRVPYREWAGLQAPDRREQVMLDLLHMDQVLLTGLAALPPESQQAFVDHVMDKTHWARKTKASKPPPPPPPPVSSNAVAGEGDGAKKKAAKSGTATQVGTDSSTVDYAGSATAMVARKAGAKAKFVLPRPGVNGAMAADHFSGKTFVLSGIFPEVGGGAGLNLGKDRVKAMIQSFGGRVTSSISGKTSYLVVGKAPGMSKVGKARALKLPMVDLAALTTHAYGTLEKLDDAPPPTIRSFSAGYQGAAYLGYD